MPERPEPLVSSHKALETSTTIVAHIEAFRREHELQDQE
jgi:hypothetical protein